MAEAETTIVRRTDVATSAVIREALNSVVREMRRAMVQSSYSSIIYEGYDFSCVLIDGQGRLVAESGEDHPFHIIPVAGAVQGALAIHGAIAENDILLHNDPYTGGTHLNDVAVIWPVHQDGAALFYVVIRSHWGDIGGMTPGSLNGAATDILQEGLRLNFLKIDKSGKSEMLRMIFDNVRATAEAASDFQAVLGICRVAERRLRDLAGKYGTATLRDALEDILDGAERRMRDAVRRLPKGTFRHIGYIDGNASTPHPLEVHVKLTIADDHVEADFTGTSAQVAAPLNAGPAIAPTSVMTVLKSFLDPTGPINSGTLRVISVVVPPGTIVNAARPAPCGGLNEVRFGCDAAVMGALGQAVPGRMTGDVRGTSNHTYIGGHDFIFYEYPSGGTGAWSEHDGNVAVRAFNEGENVSIQSTEVVERVFPLRVVRQEIRQDSGGPGRHRGGCGLVREIEVMTDQAKLSVLSDRNIIPPAGVSGGESGAPNRYSVRRDGKTVEPSDFPGKIANFPLRPGDVVVMESSGGGGFGKPTERPPERLRDDLADGYVTAATRDRYEVAAPMAEACVSAAVASGQCRIARGLASASGIGPGDLIELIATQGPARRYWVAAIDDTLDDGWVSVGPDGRAGPQSLRRLTPARVPA
ncbi:hydantoinase B/oxoprolinase family protein [Bosea sp. (in: a-proteobacteria)]|uniref:hydantoinase B/oxoprolinase family protein n=1 Tax=Bosea sp. (in: a-proteobacteria) TaxID=1871050 RepID=UPI002624E3EF|nr:hydantoinase B/oxoprolinase family protein [Bosea sp. (in: a-proteobacteria)]MCO5089522.1 hydantoinase B/oxoprolinase family protein [Bosea sp. (in: a-proteobacteria)]